MTFDEKLEELSQEVLRARATYEAWWTLKSKKIRPKFVRTMNLYSEYFRVAIHSHFVAMLMVLFRMYDSDAKALSLPCLIRSLKCERSLPKDRQLKFERAIKGAEPTMKKTRLLRDKVFAHHDRPYTYERAFREANLSANEVRRLIERSLRIVNLLRKDKGMKIYIFQKSTEHDLLALLGDLHRCNQSGGI